ncbi:ShlB/FhaC/HecB family hemolysin secretion/activation protein [Zoogloea sp.]|uniref:ShlB/FhaC/HecB family hemolysin secretion/activation protein n=1 Tax=Zoogloea sp. TaxID=49181 RepID=UPI0026278344|nr:ShlB/FhaC/HecB family hemolysin secretion/activation protein [Zoogloea sp.]MDD3354005.1 ShlB/FhaC/HecB family hemolysin secretion/activation protein [Zoogloea sp.]
MSVPKVSCALMTASLILPALPASAQALPSPTPELIRRQEREKDLREQQERAPDVRLESPVVEVEQPLPKGETPCFPIYEIRLQGEASEHFQWALAALDKPDDPAIGQCLGTIAINRIMGRLQNRIIARGFVTSRVLAEPQDLSSGILYLTLLPGRVRAITTPGGDFSRARLEPALPTRQGALLNLRDIEQGLENLKRVPSASADIQIAPTDSRGAQPGDSDLIVTWRQDHLLRLNLTLDDSGTKATGRFLGGMTVSLDNALGLSDLLYLSLNHGLGGGRSGQRGAHGHTVHYSVPLGYWLASLTAGQHRYHQAIAGATQTYRYSGTSENAEGRLARIVHRDAQSKTSTWVKAWMRRSDNFINDTEVLVQRRRMGGWEAGLSHRHFLGAAIVDASYSYRRGTGAFGSTPAPEEAFGEGSAKPGLHMMDLHLNHPFPLGTHSLRYSTQVRFQRSESPLVPQDRFAIGGRYTVRGFDGENLLSGEHGWLWRNELAARTGHAGLESYLGVDIGGVSGRSSRHLLGQRLAGAVLGLRSNIGNLAWDVFVGHALHHPKGFAPVGTVAGFSLNWGW